MVLTPRSRRILRRRTSLHNFRRAAVRLVLALLIAAAVDPIALAVQEASTSPTAKRPMTVEDLWAMDRVGSPVVSPDGTHVVFPVTRYDMEANEGNTDLWIVSTKDGKPARRLTWRKKGDSSPAFAPDGRSIAFVSSRDGSPAQLYRLPLDGGEAQRLTDLPFAVVAPRWLPDGSGLVFLGSTWADLGDDFDAVTERLDKAKKDEVQAKITESRNLRYWDHYTTDDRVPHFFHVDLESREVKDLTPGMDRLMDFRSPGDHFDVAPDGKHIAFSANTTKAPYQKLDFDLFELAIETGEIRNLTEGHAPGDHRPRYSPDGSAIAFARHRRAEIHPDFQRLARYDRATGTVTELCASFDGAPSGFEYARRLPLIFFHAQVYGETRLFGVHADGGDPVEMTRGGVTSSVASGPGFVVYKRESTMHPPELEIQRFDQEPERLTRLNDERIAALDLGTRESVTYRGYGDEPVQMWVVHPPGFDPKADWPLLMVIHGGPHGATLDRWHTRWNLALFASTGAVVAAPNFHGSTGFGQHFAESILGNHAEKPFVDVMRATDYMEGRGYIDRSRMLASGGSYGGYLVCWILGHTDRYAGLINHAGVYDLLSQYSSDWTWGRDHNYGAAPWTDPARIDLASPSRHAANFATPTLSLHGELDYRVPVHQAIQLHQVLTGKGVRSRLALFPDEDHWIAAPHAARVWWSEIFAWMREYAGTR